MPHTAETLESTVAETDVDPLMVQDVIARARNLTDRTRLTVTDCSSDLRQALSMTGLDSAEPKISVVINVDRMSRAVLHIGVDGIESVGPHDFSFLPEAHEKYARSQAANRTSVLLDGLESALSGDKKWRLLRRAQHNNEYYISRWDGQCPWLTSSQAMMVIGGVSCQLVRTAEEYL